MVASGARGCAIAYPSFVRCAVVHPVLVSFALGIAVAGIAACNDSQPPAKTPQKEEGVPANSLSDARLHGEGSKPKNEPESENDANDPTQPYTTKVGEAPPPEAGGSGKKPGTKDNGGGGKGAVSKSECDRVMDRYIELEISANPQLKDVPPEVIEQAKQMTREKHGDAPCSATRAQYTCAMAATSTAAWQRCMK
jgi:hypothetical protein